MKHVRVREHNADGPFSDSTLAFCPRLARMGALNAARTRVSAMPFGRRSACTNTQPSRRARRSGLRQCSAPVLKRNHCCKDVLLRFDRETSGCSISCTASAISVVVIPDARSRTQADSAMATMLDHANEAGIRLAKLAFDDPGCDARLHGVVLREITNDDIWVESDHRRLRRDVSSIAPVATAAFIACIPTDRRERLTIPRKAAADLFGNRTTLPSGCTKNLTRSPALRPRRSRIAFGIVACPFVVIADSLRQLFALVKM